MMREAATSPHPLSIQQIAIKVMYRLENRAHPSWLHGIIPCRFCLYVGRHAAFLLNEPLNLASPMLADQSTLANAAVLDHVPLTSMCSVVLEQNQTSSRETGFHVAAIRPGFTAPQSGLLLPSYHHCPQHRSKAMLIPKDNLMGDHAASRSVLNPPYVDCLLWRSGDHRTLE